VRRANLSLENGGNKIAIVWNGWSLQKELKVRRGKTWVPVPGGADEGESVGQGRATWEKGVVGSHAAAIPTWRASTASVPKFCYSVATIPAAFGPQ